MQMLPLLGFTLAMSITPGPNNVMVAASAANHGIRATLPHVCGIATGFGLMVSAVGLGVGELMRSVPVLDVVMRWAGLAWLLLIAWQIARADGPGHGARRPPLGFVGAALFQWINPKAWIMALSASSAWISPNQPLAAQLAIIVATFVAVGAPCMLVWALLGRAAADFLDTPARVRAFNVAMGALLAVSVIPVALGE